jgi:hypothetical protein
MLKKIILVFLILCLGICPAYAWDQSFDGHPNDLSMSMFYDTGGDWFKIVNVYSYAHGLGGMGNTEGTTGDNPNRGLMINAPFTGYLGMHVLYIGPDHYSACSFGFEMLDSSGNVIYSIPTIWGRSSYGDSNWNYIEVIRSGNSINIYNNGQYGSTYLCNLSNTGSAIRLKFDFGHYENRNMFFIDDFTTSSSHTIIGMDGSASISDEGQYYTLGAPDLPGEKYYQTRLYGPGDKVYFVENFTNATLKKEHMIPSSALTDVGDYTLHLYRIDSAHSSAFVNMKSFEVIDPAATKKGSITVDKANYEAGETVKVWTHLNEYSSGYKVRCEFNTGGMNMRKEYDITTDPQLGSFTIPDISNVVGFHTVYLLDPAGKVVNSADFNVYIPGLPDIAFDKAKYERTDKVNIYYKDAKPGSEISVTFRSGGTTVQILSYSVSGSGTVQLNLANMPSADSVYAVIKDDSGYANDNDNAKIVVGDYLLTGRVYDAKTGAVISHATVTVQGKSTNTDSNGNYNISALAGFANYSVSTSGYNGISGTVAVFDLETIHNFYLSPVITNGGTGVYGTVVSAKTDYPLVGASVEVTNTNNLKRYSTIVDNRGYYSVSHDDLAGPLTVRVSYNNYDSIVATINVSSGSMQNHNFRLNAVTGYQEIDPSEHTGGQDSDGNGESAAEKEYKEKYGEMGKHPFDFNSDGQVENSEWKYAFERIGMLLGCLAFMGFMLMIGRRR